MCDTNTEVTMTLAPHEKGMRRPRSRIERIYGEQMGRHLVSAADQLLLAHSPTRRGVQMIGSKVICLVLCGMTIIGSTGCAQEAAGGRDDSSSAGRENASERLPRSTSRYGLVLLDRKGLPQSLDESNDGCARQLVAAHYELSEHRWTSFDSVITTCPAGRSARPDSVRPLSGTIRRVGDTLVFQTYDEGLRTTLRIDRGLLRHDTPLTSGPLSDGPPRVYVRRH
jgi:hypothetical protein